MRQNRVLNVKEVKLFTFVGFTPERSRPMRRSMQLRIITVRTWRRRLKGNGATQDWVAFCGFLCGARGRFLLVNSDELVVVDGSWPKKRNKSEEMRMRRRRRI